MAPASSIGVAASTASLARRQFRCAASIPILGEFIKSTAMSGNGSRIAGTLIIVARRQMDQRERPVIAVPMLCAEALGPWERRTFVQQTASAMEQKTGMKTSVFALPELSISA